MRKETANSCRNKAMIAPILPLLAIGGSLLARASAKVSNQRGSDDYLCHSSGPLGLAGDYIQGTLIGGAYTGYAAESADYFEQPSYVKHYFRNLTKEFPTNNAGNCGYTAAAMLLSYYDVYWNERIVPDRYNRHELTALEDPGAEECSSPGINDYFAPVWTERNPRMDPPDPDNPDLDYEDRYNANESEAYSVYLDYMLARTNDNLISELYSIALSSSVNVYHKDINNRPGINMADLTTVVNEYFIRYNLAGLLGLKTVTIDSFSDDYPKIEAQREALRKAAIDRIKSGQPILFKGGLRADPKSGGLDKAGNAITRGGHFGVAYDHLDSDDYIMGHIGWKGDREYSWCAFDKEFETFDAFAYLEVSPDLDFSPRNYRYQWKEDPHGRWRPLAAAGLECHEHGNRVAIDFGDPGRHALQCICGDVEYEPHEMTIIRHDEECHALSCRCGRVVYEPHSLIPISDVGYYCRECGEVIALNNPHPGVPPWEHVND